MEKYTLWLKPEGKNYQELRDLIIRLAHEYGGPIFEPHVTLLGDLSLSKEEALVKSFELSQTLEPYEVELNSLDYTDYYFRCVFIKAKKTKEILKANLLAQKIFDRKEEYMPHLSLLYGNFDENIKRKITLQLGSLDFKLKVKSIYLTNTSIDTKLKDWQILAEFPFGIVDSLKKGKIGVIPTDTIYGIVGSALNKKTVEEIYRLKKRPKKKPFIILISKLDDLKKFDINLTKDQIISLEKIWPNPVSVVLGNLAFRMPKDKWLLSLLERVGPLVAPSANFEGKKPAQGVVEARKYFGEKIAFYLDQGKIKSKPSTLIRLNEDESFDILRQGSQRV